MASKERCTNRPVTICMCLCAYFIGCFFGHSTKHTHTHTLAPDQPQFALHCQIAALNGRQRRHNLPLLLQLPNVSEQRKKWGKKTASTIWKIRENCVAAAAIKVAGPPVHLFLLRLQSLLLLLIKLNNPINHFVLSVFCCENSNMCYDCESLTDLEFPFTDK